MAIKELDRDTVNSIYNKFVFTAKPQEELLDKKSVVSISNNLTSIQNAFNVLSASIFNINKLNEYKTKREAQISNEKAIEGSSSQRLSATGSVSADFSSTIEGFRVLTKYFEEIDKKLQELDLSNSCDIASGIDGTGDVDAGDDVDGRKKRKGRGRGGRGRGRGRPTRSRAPRTGGRGRGGGRPTRSRAPRMGGRGLSLGGKLFGVLGVGLDVADRVSEGQGLTQTAVGVGGGLAGATLGAKAGAALGGTIGSAFFGVGAAPGAAIGGLLGGVGGYLAGGSLADKGYEAVTKAELPKGSYSEKFAKFLQGSISNVVNTVTMFSPVTAGVIAAGKSIYDSTIGGEDYSLSGSTKADFQTIMDMAAKAGAPHPEIVAAQWALESGYGKKMSGKNNPFGQKAAKNEDGTVKTTREFINGQYVTIQDKFKNYDSLDEAIAHHVKKWNLKTTYGSTPVEAIKSIYDRGYATDPQYINKINQVLASNNIDPNEPYRYTTPADAVAPGGMVELSGDASHIELTSGTGKRDVIKKGEDHPGLDLVHKKRTPNTLIASATGGEVVYAGLGRPKTGYGRMGYVVSIKDGGKYYVYAHLAKGSVSVKTGDTVSPGTVLGIMGSTGLSTGVHLHFEIRAGKNAPSWGSQIMDANVLKSFVNSHPWIIGGKKTEGPGPKFDPKSYTKPTGDLLLDPRKKKPVKTVVVPKVVYVPVSQGKGGPGSSPPQSPRSDSSKKLPYYIGRN